MVTADRELFKGLNFLLKCWRYSATLATFLKNTEIV